MFSQVFLTYIPSVSVVFYVCCNCFHLDVLKVDLMLCLYAYFKCSIYLHTYVTSIVCGCFKSRLDVCISLLVFLYRIGVSSSFDAD
jgi:hypothetical protein